MAKVINYHVVASKVGWVVKNEGSDRASRRFRTQAEAIEWARQLARQTQTDLVVHGRDGKIRSKDSYGNDPNPPRDKKQ